MPDTAVETVSLAARPDLSDAHHALGGSVWPAFMLHDPVAVAHLGTIFRDFAGHQLSLVAGGALVAVVNAVPLRVGVPSEALPDRGVDWGVERAVAGHAAGEVPDCLMGMQVVVDPARRGEGLSRAAVRAMIALARERGLERVILPVRPAQKHRYPLIPMADYIRWTDGDGLPFDGWLRVHARLGARLVRVCPRSMIIPGTVADWTEWTGLAFPGSGRYIVPGALVPVEIDREADRGLYVEPNVWMVHEAG